MASNTTNYNLVKPDYSDTADIAVINGNMDIIDSTMKTNATNIESKQDSLVGRTLSRSGWAAIPPPRVRTTRSSTRATTYVRFYINNQWYGWNKVAQVIT